LQPVLMRISTGCKSSWYLWPAVIKGKGFGTGLKHHPVPKLQYRNRLVPPTGTKSTRRNRYRLVTSTGAYAFCLAPVVEHQPVPLSHAYKYPNPSPLQAVVNSLFMTAE